MNDKSIIFANTLGKSVVFFRPQVISLLNKNEITSDAEKMNSEQLINSVIIGIKVSENFRNEYEKLIDYNEKNMDDNYLGISADAWLSSGTKLLEGTLGFFGNKEQTNAIKAQANAQANVAQTQLEIAKINQETELAKLKALEKNASIEPPPENKTKLYIGLGVGGALILGLVVYLAVKK